MEDGGAEVRLGEPLDAIYFVCVVCLMHSPCLERPPCH